MKIRFFGEIDINKDYYETTIHLKDRDIQLDLNLEEVIGKKDWILENIKRVESKTLEDGYFLYLGEKKLLSDFAIKNLDSFYKKEIDSFISTFIEKYSNLMQLFPTKISYRKNKRTWGSCNYKNELNFNILLMKFPLYIMEYIVIHELAHIKHKNHSKKFWELVEKYSPNYKEIEKIFKTLL